MLLESTVPHPVTDSEAVQLAREIFGLEARARPLPGEYDHNFHITAVDGLEFVLKVMHPDRKRTFIELQAQALQLLAVRAPGAAIPHVQRTLQGDLFTQVTLSDGEQRFVWMLSFLPGKVLARVNPHTPELLEALGDLLGQIDRALQDFSHPAASREFKWDLTQAAWIRDFISCIEDSSRRAMVERVLAEFETSVVPLFPKLRKSVIYGDANDYNVLVNRNPRGDRVGIIDFGDMHHGLVVAEPAVAAAYAILGKDRGPQRAPLLRTAGVEDRPLEAAAAVVRGFHRALPLDEIELQVLFPLIKMRLAVSVVNSARRKSILPNDPYVTISEAPAWEALERLEKIHPRFAHYTFRNACGLMPHPRADELLRWLTTCGHSAAPVLDVDLRTGPCHVLDLSVSSAFLGGTPQLTEGIERELRQTGATVGIGRYDEPRLLYTSALFGSTINPLEERRTIHLGIDLFVPPGSNVHAPLEGVVYAVADNQAPLDYGPVVILKHTTGEAGEYFTLYGHLSRESTRNLTAGQFVAKGEVFAGIGTDQENGGWAPHLHFQVIADLLELDRDFPGVAAASEREVWKSICPDPNLLLQIPQDRFPKNKDMTFSETLTQRRKLLGPNLSISYKNPLKIVRGWRQYLYDDCGRAYLDVYNNVPLVGHSHPGVVRAVQQQMGILNTNTRYLHQNIVRYAGRLTEKLPAPGSPARGGVSCDGVEAPLGVCYFLNSGSEANELALRLARAHTRHEDVIVLEHAYHGHTSTLIDISPYKFNGPGGRGRKPWVHVVPVPDDYRGLYRRGEPDLGRRYAAHVAEALDGLREQQRGISAYIAETLPSVAGQIVFPEGYLAEVYAHVRAQGGLCIADEVQVGFGRLGSHFWGFQTQGVVPDIVVLGKPIGNGFPLAAVITTPEIAASFDNGMEFFSTYGGNPVACAAGLAVLDVLEEERLQENALTVGNYLIARLKELQAEHPIIGDVRGLGLFLGLDLVQDPQSRQPATDQASYVANRLRDRGVLTGTDGPHHNVLKLRPPLIFSKADADLFVNTLDSVLGEDGAQPFDL